MFLAKCEDIYCFLSVYLPRACPFSYLYCTDGIFVISNKWVYTLKILIIVSLVFY